MLCCVVLCCVVLCGVVQSKFGNTPLLFAADGGAVEVVTVLLAHGANVNILNKVCGCVCMCVWVCVCMCVALLSDCCCCCC